MNDFRTTIGVDIGQKRDPTALAVAEVEHRRRGQASQPKESHYLIRFLERLPLGTPYPEVARHIARVCQQVRRRTGKRPILYVDATGVGQPILDLLNGAAIEVESTWAVYFTRGEKRREFSAERRITLGKAFLVNRLQALLQHQRIHLPKGHREAGALIRELLDYEIRVGENAAAKFGAFRSGTHDDLVTALGLAIQSEPQRI